MVGVGTQKQKKQTFTDPRDGEVYPLISIGTQTWFAENLRYKTEGSIYNSNNPNPKYGRLYTWEDALTACPEGWHLPTDREWTILELALGMPVEEVGRIGWCTINGHLKSTRGWAEDGHGDNSLGFNAYPAGTYSEGEYHALGECAYFWSATTNYDESAWYRYLFHDNNQLGRFDPPKSMAYSCRCLKDE